MGKKERSGIIQDIDSRENSLILIKQDIYKANWQLPKEVIDYVKENYEKIDEIDIFDIYVKGDKE